MSARKTNLPPPPPWAVGVLELASRYEAASTEAIRHLRDALALFPPDAALGEWLRKTPALHESADRNVAMALRYQVSEALRPKGPMVTVETTEHWDVRLSEQVEIERLTRTQVVLRGGRRFCRDGGYEIRRNDGSRRWRIAAADLATLNAEEQR